MSTEKRLFLFLVLTFLILAGYATLVEMFAPPRPVPPVVAEKDQLGGEIPPEEPLEKGATPPADAASEKAPDRAVTAERPLPPDASPTPDRPPPDGPVGEPQPVTHPHQVITLGSYHPAPGESPLLVWLTSRGAALDRVELVERVRDGGLRYLDLDNTSGYLGNLSLAALPSGSPGSRVHSVPAGSPAALAQPANSSDPVGLRVGDVITSVDGDSIERPAEFERLLAPRKPGAIVKLTVQREIEGQGKTIQYSVTLDRRPLELIQREPLSEKGIRIFPPSLLLSIKQASPEQSAYLDQLRDVEWGTRVLQGPVPGVEFHYTVTPSLAKEVGLSGPVEVIKRYRLGKTVNAASASQPAYHLDFEIELKNIATEPQSLVYRLDGPNGLPVEGWWYHTKIHPSRWFQGAGARDVALRTESDGHRLIGCAAILSRAKDDEKSPRTPLFSEGEPEPYRSLYHIGVDTQYFAAVLIPQANPSAQPDAPIPFSRAEALVLGDPDEIPKGWERTANASFQLASETIRLEPNEPFVRRFQLFAGPKDPPILAHYGLGEWIYYGWFGWMSKLLSQVLHFFYAICGNYGIAIMLLTVLVRSCMFPISRTAARNAAMMQELAPEMRKIAEKHKNNLEARGKAQQELFRQHNYNPLSGCWLMFLQLPVFIGLYRCLAVDIELRQAPLIPGIGWSSNLAGPDKLFYWKTDFLSYFTDESGWLGPYFNLLPIFTIILFLLHQKLFTPPATDEQTELQMKMMKFMTIFMGILFYKVPAGLCLYFITSSMWGIAERKLLPKPTPPKKDEGIGGGGGGSKLANFFGKKPSPQPDNGNARKKELERKLRRNK